MDLWLLESLLEKNEPTFSPDNSQLEPTLAVPGHRTLYHSLLSSNVLP